MIPMPQALQGNKFCFPIAPRAQTCTEQCWQFVTQWYWCNVLCHSLMMGRYSVARQQGFSSSIIISWDHGGKCSRWPNHQYVAHDHVWRKWVLKEKAGKYRFEIIIQSNSTVMSGNREGCGRWLISPMLISPVENLSSAALAAQGQVSRKSFIREFYGSIQCNVWQIHRGKWF